MSADNQGVGYNPNEQDSQDAPPQAEESHQDESGESSTDETAADDDDPGVPQGNSATSSEDDNENEKEVDADGAGILSCIVLNGTMEITVQAKSVSKCLALSHKQINALPKEDLTDWLKWMQVFMAENIDQNTKINDTIVDLKEAVEELKKTNQYRQLADESELLEKNNLIKEKDLHNQSITNHLIEVSKELIEVRKQLISAKDAIAQMEKDGYIQDKEDLIAKNKKLQQMINVLEARPSAEPTSIPVVSEQDPQPTTRMRIWRCIPCLY